MNFVFGGDDEGYDEIVDIFGGRGGPSLNWTIFGSYFYTL